MKNLKANENLYYYFYFLKERMNIFWNKYHNNKPPFSDDEILTSYKFTNVYRVLDRVSQYLVKNIINNDKNYSSKDIVFRIILFKIFNKIETWEFLEKEFEDLKIENFSYERFSEKLDSRIKNKPIFSAAYIMTGACAEYANIGSSKHRKWLKLLDDYFVNGDTIEKILSAESLEEVYLILIKIPMIGRFIAYQYAIDLNYSKIINFSENDFVVAGPGALRGVKKTFDKFNSAEQVIIYISENFDSLLKEYGFEKEFKSLYGRKPTLIDLQNVFCEVDKYLRAKKPELNIKNTRIKQKYFFQIGEKRDIKYSFPKKWNLKK